MEADPWRNPFADEGSARQDTGSQPPHAPTSLAWEPSPTTFNVAAVTPSASALEAGPTWDPAGDEVDTVWTWQPTSKSKPASPKWEPVAFESRTWPPDDAFVTDKGEGLHEVTLESTTTRHPSPPAESSTMWSGGSHTSPVAEVHPRTPSPSTSIQQDKDAAVPRSPSPDEFGGFEVAKNEPDDFVGGANSSLPGGAGAMLFDEAAPSWDSTGPIVESPPMGSEPTDEWQLATAARERRDLVAPPHVVNGWIREMQSLLDGMWKPPETDDTITDWRSSASILDDISSMMDTMLPPLHLERPPDISKSAIHKASIAALKLTRHSAVAQSSPLAKFHAMRGSTSWEESVKKRVNPVAEGWGIFDTMVELDPAPASETEVKKPSGLLSFFSRGGTVQPALIPPPATTASTPPIDVQTISSAGPSYTSGRTDGESKIAVTEKTKSEGAIPSKVSLDTPRPPATSESAGGQSSLTTRQDDDPPQSAVSRFLGRFSRSKGETDLHKPLSLSDADISFLNDAVPSALEPANIASSVDPFEPDAGLLGSTSPLQTYNSTPPLAPPVSSARTLVTTTTLANPAPPHVSSSALDDDVWNVFTLAPNPAPLLPPPVTVATPQPSRPVSDSIANASLSKRANTNAAGTARRAVPVRMASAADQTGAISTIPALLPPPRRVATPLPRSLDLSVGTRDTTPPSGTDGAVTASPTSVLSPGSAKSGVVPRRVSAHATEQSTRTPSTAGSSHDSSLLLNYESRRPGASGEFGDFAKSSPSRTVPLPSQVLAAGTSAAIQTLPRRTVGTDLPINSVPANNSRYERSRTPSTSSPTIPATAWSNTNGSSTVNLNFEFLRAASPSSTTVNSQSNAHASSPQLTRGAAKPSVSAVPARKSGLSAQDLSFFESL